eukprot:7436770-Pyramimonas_sp.AAC.1
MDQSMDRLVESPSAVCEPLGLPGTTDVPMFSAYTVPHGSRPRAKELKADRRATEYRRRRRRTISKRRGGGLRSRRR